MKVRVIYFGVVRERLGIEAETYELADGAVVGDFQRQLAARIGDDRAGAGAVRVAVNREYVDSGHALLDNDEIAVIPPVSGG